MVDAADVTLLALAGGDPAGAPNAGALSVVELGERLEMGAATMADRIELLTTLSEMEAEGLVASHTVDDGTVYALTGAGRERAATLYREVADRRIEVRNGGTERVALGAVDQYLPEPAVARALARLTEDDVLYVHDEVDRGFVDRTAPLATLADHRERARDGAGGAVLVTGPAGVGKTALVEEFRDRSEGVRVLEGIARADADRPYAPVREALAPALDGSPFDRSDDEPVDRRNLETLRATLFADVADALGELGAAAPVVLVLEDLHHAGQPTLDLVGVLADRIAGDRVLLVATSWRASLADDHGIHDLVDAWAGADAHAHLPLAPFDREHTRALLQATLGTRRIPAAFVDLVAERTGGMPEFVVETCSRMRAEGTLAPEHEVFPTDPGAASVPASVEQAIEARLGVLDAAGETVLSTAALLGEEFAVDDLVAVLARDRATVREYLDVLVDATVLRPVADRPDRLRFQSGMFRETVVDRLPDDERPAYHRRIAAALAPRADDDPAAAATIAHHHERAGDRERALEAWIAAAEHAEDVYAQDVARDHYERALAIAREAGDDDRVVDVLLAMGRVEFHRADLDAAERAYESVRERADDDRAVTATARLTHLVKFRGEYEAAVDLAEAGLAEWDGETPTLAVHRLLQNKGTALYRLGRFDAATADTERALAVARELDDDDRIAASLVSLGQVHDSRANYDRAIAVYERAREHADRAGNRRLAGTILLNLGVVYGRQGDVAAGIDTLREGRAVNEELDRPTKVAHARMNLGNLLARGARFAPAREHLEAAIDTFRAHEFRSLEGAALWFLGELCLEQGDLAAADDRLHRSLEHLAATGMAEQEAVARAALAEWAVLVGDPEEARSQAATALATATEVGAPRPTVRVRIALGAVCRRQGDVDDALEHHRAAVERLADLGGAGGDLGVRARVALARTLLAADRAGGATEHAERAADAVDREHDAVEWVRATATLGRCRHATGDADDAAALLRTALAAARDSDLRPQACRIRFHLGRVERDRGDRAAARSMLRQARDDADAIGATGLRDRCAAALEEC